MPHIIRDDGERFVIPSYRDTLTVKKASLLKREILLLTENYGDYITLQKKAQTQFEVAFSSESGTLLGETVWHYFKRPRDLIYCEALPDTNEVILVIVKSGSVYLDGSFPVDTVPEELIVFQTQQNNFEIYLYGDVPISETQESGKFTFDKTSVKSFTYLEASAFKQLPILKSFQLQLVDVVLRSHGIGTFPIKPVLIVVAALFAIFIFWEFISTEAEEIQVAVVAAKDPYEDYIKELRTPDPTEQIQALVKKIILFSSIPGWRPISYNYNAGSIEAPIRSAGTRSNVLFDWAARNNATVTINPSGFILSTTVNTINRPAPTAIYSSKKVLANLMDKISYILPNNPLKVSTMASKGKYNITDLSIDFQQISPTTLALIGQQLKDLPITLFKVTLSVSDGSLTGKIELRILGN